MIDLNKNKTSIFEEDVELSQDDFVMWSRGYISYALHFYDEKTLPLFFAKDCYTFLAEIKNNDGGADMWIYWLRGYLDHIEPSIVTEYKGFAKIINYLKEFI